MLFALMLIMSAFLLPIGALAKDAPTEEEPPQYTPLPTAAEEKPEEPVPEWSVPPQSPWADAPETDNPFTPPGSATVVDNATSDDGKEFFTFQTPEGNVFFLIIDRSRGQDNVYFLNAVTEQDLMALATSSGGNAPFDPVPSPLPIPDLDDPTEELEPPTVASEVQGGSNGTIIFIVIATLAFGGAAYYLKIVRPKKQGTTFDDDDEYEYEDEEELDDDNGDELDEEYDVEDIIREFGSGRRNNETQSEEEEEELFEEIY